MDLVDAALVVVLEEVRDDPLADLAAASKVGWSENPPHGLRILAPAELVEAHGAVAHEVGDDLLALLAQLADELLALLEHRRVVGARPGHGRRR